MGSVGLGIVQPIQLTGLPSQCHTPLLEGSTNPHWEKLHLAWLIKALGFGTYAFWLAGG